MYIMLPQTLFTIVSGLEPKDTATSFILRKKLGTKLRYGPAEGNLSIIVFINSYWTFDLSLQPFNSCVSILLERNTPSMSIAWSLSMKFGSVEKSLAIIKRLDTAVSACRYSENHSTVHCSKSIFWLRHPAWSVGDLGFTSNFFCKPFWDLFQARMRKGYKMVIFLKRCPNVSLKFW